MHGYGPHLSDEALASLADPDANERESRRVREHLEACAACRLRRDALLGLRAELAAAGEFERAPRRDAVPSALKRLRLRRHAIVNANELLGGLVAFVRGLSELFAAGDFEGDARARRRPPENEPGG